MKPDTSKWPQWLKDAITENADIEINKFGSVVWRGGVWRGGVWRGGVWRGGVWRGGEWRGGVKGDFFDLLLRVPHEVDGLIATLKAGNVDGSCYEGDCCCLCGTIANLRHCNYRQIPGLTPDSTRPIERFFLAIRPGHTPENNPWCKQAVAWAEEFQELIANLSKIK
jgi:hypothetical protein